MLYDAVGQVVTKRGMRFLKQVARAYPDVQLHLVMDKVDNIRPLTSSSPPFSHAALAADADCQGCRSRRVSLGRERSPGSTGRPTKTSSVWQLPRPAEADPAVAVAV